MSSLQTWLYLVQRSMGDVEAAQKGRLGKRLVRRQVMRRAVGPMMNRLFR